VRHGWPSPRGGEPGRLAQAGRADRARATRSTGPPAASPAQPLDLLAFAALGPHAAALGIPASLVSSAIGGAVFALLARGPMAAGGPAAALVLAALVARVAAEPAFVASDPVALALLLALPPLMFGWPVGVLQGAGWVDAPPVQPATVLVGLFTVAVILGLPRFNPKLPANLIGLLAGAGAYALLHAVAPQLALGPLTGALPSAWPQLDTLAPFFNGLADPLLQRHGLAALTAGLVMTLIGTLELVLNSLAMDQACDTRTDPRREVLALAVVGVVCVVTVVLGFPAAVAAGALLSVVLFIRSMHRPLVRSRGTAEGLPSRRIYAAADEERLRITVLELEGALFFGSADRITALADALDAGCHTLVLDFRRVSLIDASGAVLRTQLSRRLHDRGIGLLLAGVGVDNRHGRSLLPFAGDQYVAAHGAADIDQAVERAELRLPAQAGHEPLRETVPLEQVSPIAGLDADQRNTAAALREPVARHLAGRDRHARRRRPQWRSGGRWRDRSPRAGRRHAAAVACRRPAARRADPPRHRAASVAALACRRVGVARQPGLSARLGRVRSCRRCGR
jgi:MFS superfamily sulfate permease-like transporter